MLIKEITFTDMNGNEKTEVHYFNMTKAEILKYDAQYAEAGGVIEYLTSLIKRQKTAELMAAFEDLILRSYGEKTANGKFIKSQELRDAFVASEAYSELFMEIVGSEGAAAAFVNGIIPQVPQANPQVVAPALG